MIFWQLFLTFSNIGILNFGGGYAMLSLIHNEVVEKNAWLTASEFTDIVAISQSTPGPIGINVATYTGYISVLNSGMPEWAAVLGAIVATLGVLWLPFLLMIVVSRLLLKSISSMDTDKTAIITSMFSVIRPAVVGLIAAAAILLMNSENFGSFAESPFQFIISLFIFGFAFIGSLAYKTNPIILLLLCGLAGLMIF